MSVTEQGMPAKALSARAVLIKVDSVMDLCGKTADEVYEMATGSALKFDRGFQFVFNVATDPLGEIRDLRFWAREVIAPETVVGWSIDQALDSIVPKSRTNFHSGDVVRLLHVRRPTLLKLREELNGKLAANSAFFAREALATFLRRRWLGGAP